MEPDIDSNLFAFVILNSKARVTLLSLITYLSISLSGMRTRFERTLSSSPRYYFIYTRLFASHVAGDVFLTCSEWIKLLTSGSIFRLNNTYKEMIHNTSHPTYSRRVLRTILKTKQIPNSYVTFSNSVDLDFESTSKFSFIAINLNLNEF